MIGAVAASKIERYAAQIGDRSLVLSELELHRVVHDCKKLLQDPKASRDPHAGNPMLLQSLIGCAYSRRGKHPEALDWYKRAIALGRNDLTLTNLGVGLMNMGDVEGAMAAWVDAIEECKPTGSDAVILFGNLAEALMTCGSVQDAWAAFQEAVKQADMCSTFDTFILAHQAAELGADNEAGEFFARHLSVRLGVAIGDSPAPDFLRRFPSDVVLHALGAASDTMRAAIARAAGVLTLNHLPLDHVSGGGDAPLLERMFEETKPLRGRANYFGLREHVE